jgi:hypothetical protein
LVQPTISILKPQKRLDFDIPAKLLSIADEVIERSREEKAQGREEQKEQRPDRLDVLARTDDWERRFRREILVPVKRL